jgi:hypothetical protein
MDVVARMWHSDALFRSPQLGRQWGWGSFSTPPAWLTALYGTLLCFARPMSACINLLCALTDLTWMICRCGESTRHQSYGSTG